VVRHTTQNPEGIECVIQRVVIGVIALSNIQRSMVNHSLGDVLADLDPKPSVDWPKSDCAADKRLFLSGLVVVSCRRQHSGPVRYHD